MFTIQNIDVQKKWTRTSPRKEISHIRQNHQKNSHSFRKLLKAHFSAAWSSLALAVMRCLCVSVTFANSVKTNKRIFKIFSPSGSQTILFFQYQTAWQYSDGNLANRGFECMWGANSEHIAGFTSVLWTVPAASAIHLAAIDHAEFITLVAVKWPSLLTARNNDEVYDKKPQRYAEDNVMQW